MKKFAAIFAVLMIFSCLTAALGAPADKWRESSVWKDIKPGEGLYAVLDGDSQKWGYVRYDGKQIVLPIYSKANSMRDGLAMAAYGTPSGDGIRYIDEAGKTVIDLSLSYPGATAGDFCDGVAPVYPAGGGKTCFIDRTGALVLEYDGHAAGFSEGLSPVYRDGYYGYIDMKGKTVINASFDEASKFNDGAALVKKDGKYGVINKKGDYTIEPKFEDVWMVDTGYSRAVFANGLMVVKYNGKGGAVNYGGQFKIDAKYDLMHCFQGGYAAVCLAGKWGIIDVNGELVMNTVCQDVTNAVNGYVFIKQDGAYKLYNLNTRAQEEMDTSGITYVSSFDWDNGVFLYRKNGFTGLIKIPSEPSSWAKAEIEEAINAGLIPEMMRSNYTNAITRADFCRLAVNMVEVKTGMSIDAYLSQKGYAINENAFPDTADHDLLAAHALGIITGRPDGTFGPEEFIVRQEAAAMLTRVAKVINPSAAFDKPVVFADRGKINSWAAEYVDFVSAAKVMAGNTKNEFMPTGSYLREQSFTTFIRLFKAL